MEDLGRHTRELFLPIAGLALLLSFVLIRAASFHHMDQFLRFRLAGLKMNWILELGAISLVAMAAARHRRRPKAPARRVRLA